MLTADIALTSQHFLETYVRIPQHNPFKGKY